METTMEMSDLLIGIVLCVVALAWWLSFALEDKPHKKLDEPDEHEVMTWPSSPGLPHHRRKK